MDELTRRPFLHTTVAIVYRILVEDVIYRNR